MSLTSAGRLFFKVAPTHTAAQPRAPLAHLTISRTAYCRQMEDKQQGGKEQLPRCVIGEPWDGARAQHGQKS